MSELIILNKMEELENVYDFVRQVVGQYSLSPALIDNLNLAMEEALVNVISYAYPPQEEHEIRITASADGYRLIFVITDSGIAFDPTKTGEPRLELPPGERTEGGLGIFLIKKIMDEIEYQRIQDTNIFTMKKKLI